ncbi:unnamed protein product, partial [Choristocarpus tenellus]
MLAPGSHGGLAFTPQEAGMTLALAAVAHAGLHVGAPGSVSRLLARSPIRALRVATAVQVAATVYLSRLRASSTLPEAQWIVLGSVAFAIAAMRAAGMVAKPTLSTLLSLALGGSSSPAGVAGNGTGWSGNNWCGLGSKRRLLQGTGEIIGALMAGVTYTNAVSSGGEGACSWCFRLAAGAFGGLYLLTLVVHVSSGTGVGEAGGRSGVGGLGGVGIVACDLVEGVTDVGWGSRKQDE